MENEEDKRNELLIQADGTMMADGQRRFFREMRVFMQERLAALAQRRPSTMMSFSERLASMSRPGHQLPDLGFPAAAGSLLAAAAGFTEPAGAAHQRISASSGNGSPAPGKPSAPSASQSYASRSFETDWITKLKRLADLFGQNELVVTRWGKHIEAVCFQTADTIIGRFDHAFQTIRSRYLNDPDFQRLQASVGVSFRFQDAAAAFQTWLGGGGQAQLLTISRTLVEQLAEGMKQNGALMAEVGKQFGMKLGQGMREAGSAGGGSGGDGNDSGWKEVGGFFKDVLSGTVSGILSDVILDTLIKGRNSGKTAAPGATVVECICKCDHGAAGLRRPHTTPARRGSKIPKTPLPDKKQPTMIYGPDGKPGKIVDGQLVPVPASQVPKAAAKPGISANRSGFFNSSLLGFAATGQGSLNTMPAGGGKVSLLHRIFGGLGKAVKPIGIGMDVAAIAAASPGEERRQEIGGAVGGWSGAAAGAAGGAAIGSIVPGIGTAIGGVVGGLIGGFGGDYVGRKLVSLFPSSRKKAEQAEAAIRTAEKLSIPVPTMPQEQVRQSVLTGSGKQPETNQYLNVHLPLGAVQLQVKEQEWDERMLMEKLGLPLVRQIMMSLENRV